jgi:tetratricopeptide (TPR) repeat protein
MPAPLKKSRPVRITLWSGMRLAAWALPLAAPIAAQARQDRPALDAAVRHGDSAWTAGRFPVARDAYERALSLDSAASSRSVYRLAVLRTWDGELRRAIPLFALYVRLEPRDEEGRIALAKAHAWNGQTAAAVAIYDSILARESTYRDAAFGAAQALAWAGQFKAAIARYDQWLVENPKDIEAGLSRARVLAWSGKLPEAERSYAQLGADGEHLEADKGVALVSAWRGNLGRSEKLWRGLTTKTPKDPEIWVGLAQVLRWTGRSEEARVALRKAIAVDPEHADAREQMRWVKAELGTTIEPGAWAGWDSDQNKSLTLTLAGSVRPISRTRFTVYGSYRDAELGGTTGTSTTGRASLRVHAGSRLTLTGELGQTRTRAGSAAERDFTVGGGRATLRLTSGFSIGGGVAHSAFDETAPLIASGITVTSYSGEAELRLAGRLGLSAGGESAELVGGSVPNRREAGFAVLRWKPRRTASVALSGRAFRYRESPRDGYFSPSQFVLGEISTRIGRGRDLGWAFEIEGGLGLQEVQFDNPGVTRGAQRIGASLAYRPRPGGEIVVDYGFSNVAATATGGVTGGGSVYHAHVLTLRSRLTW